MQINLQELKIIAKLFLTKIKKMMRLRNKILFL
jgi:hypothetical protein